MSYLNSEKLAPHFTSVESVTGTRIHPPILLSEYHTDLPMWFLVPVSPTGVSLFTSPDHNGNMPLGTHVAWGYYIHHERQLEEQMAFLIYNPQNALKIGDFNSTAMHTLATLETIRYLDIHDGSFLTDDALMCLKDFPDLRWLHLGNIYNGPGVSVESLKCLSAITPLETLTLQPSSRMCGKEIGLLAKLVNLRHLCANGCSMMQDSDIEPLADLPLLDTLELRCCSRIKTGESLKKFGSLQWLNMAGCPLEEFSFLAHKPTLRVLRLGYCTTVNDDHLAGISRLSNLFWLDISGNNLITDTGLSHVSQLQNLTYLTISGCQNITIDGLLHLTAARSLRWLRMDHCSKAITPEHIDTLQRKLPGCTILSKEAAGLEF